MRDCFLIRYPVDWELEGVMVEHVRPPDVFHSQSGMIHAS